MDNGKWIVNADHLSPVMELAEMESPCIDMQEPTPENYDAVFFASKDAKHADLSIAVPFRLYDDDGFLYYSGRMDAVDDGRQFRVLDEFGAASGCTRLDVLVDDKWVTL